MDEISITCYTYRSSIVYKLNITAWDSLSLPCLSLIKSLGKKARLITERTKQWSNQVS